MNKKNKLTFDDILGQPEVVKSMRTIINGDKIRNNKFPEHDNISVLFTGPSGIGKTYCAHVLHDELRNDEFIKFDSQGFTEWCFYKFFLGCDERITLFLDEAQGLDKKTQNMFATAISEGFVNSPLNGKGQTYSIPVEPFTLFLATTHEYKLIEALRNNMTMIKLTLYDDNALSQIVMNYVRSQNYRFENNSLSGEIAKRSKNTPRLAVNRIASMAMRVAIEDNRKIITEYDLKQAFKLLKIDNLGLNADERLYLTCLAKNQRLKRNVLASMTGLPSQTISEMIEPYLLRKGLICKDNNERVITAKGRTHIQIYQI